MQKFRDQNLDFVKKDFDAKKDNDSEMQAKLDEDYKKLVRRKTLYAANYVVSNANYEAAPYIALTELYNASIPLLDTVNSSFSDEIKNSTYGKRFQAYVEKVKKAEQSN